MDAKKTGTNMDIKYVSVVPIARNATRCPEGQRVPVRQGYNMQHAATVDIVPRHVVAQRQAEREKRVNKMFANMKAVEGQLPTRTRGGSDITQSDDYKALIAMPIGDPNTRDGYFAIDAGSEAKAKKMQAKVNVYARAGAGTFRTSLPQGSSVLYVKRISDVYTPQRGKGNDE